MQKIESYQLEIIEAGGNIAKAYNVSCGVATAFLEASFLAGPVVFLQMLLMLVFAL